MSVNPDSVVNQGAFHASIRPSHPLSQRHPHAPGKKIGNDAAPDFHCHTVPPGSSPPDRTFRPDTSKSIPGQSYPNSKKETWQTAESTLTGSTSRDVYGGKGQQFYGPTSRDLRDQTSHKSELTGMGATAQDPATKKGLNSGQVKHKVV